MHALGVHFLKEVNMKDLALYIHIPFCEKKCFYCDFTSFPEKTDEIHDYIEYVIKELSLYKDKVGDDYRLSSIFIGGGTPSSINEDYMEKILNYVFLNFNRKTNIEVSIEVNPGSVTIEKARKYKSIGINRVSIGLQSLNDGLLKAIGRIHNKEDFFNSYNILREVGFKNINLDLMFGLPDQSLYDLQNTLEQVTKLSINHISLYSLIIEEGTHFYNLYKRGQLNIPTEEVDREMYHKSINYLQEKGFTHYELSNFSKPGFECKQNLTYWKVEPYIGVGINSHSNLDSQRYSNFSDFKNYYNKLSQDQFPIAEIEDIDLEMEIGEYMILGLRLIEGINKDKFKTRFGKNMDEIFKIQIEKNVNNGLLVNEEHRIKLTSKGLDLCNQVELDFFS